MVFHGSLSDNKSPRVSRTLLSILANLNRSVIWMVSTRALISSSSRYFTNYLVTVPRAQITTGTNVTFMFQSFCNSQTRSRYLFLFLLSFNFTLWSAGPANSTTQQVLFFCWLLWGLVVWPRLADLFVSQNFIGVCVSHSPGQILECT